MKYLLVLLIAIPLLMGCGHLFGNSPVGVTGGGDGGYGSFGGSYNGDNYPTMLLGAWQQDGSSGIYNIITFQADGTVKVDFHNGQTHTSQNGTYYISGSRMDINVSGWQSGSGTITINNDVMTVAFTNGTITLHKAA